MFRQFFDTTEVEAFAAWIADELKRYLPPQDAEKDRINKRARKLDQRIVERAQLFAKTGGLNIYKKAKLGAKVQQLLDDAGYPEAFRRSFVYELVALVASAAARKT